jgi:hypothetical protein
MILTQLHLLFLKFHDRCLDTRLATTLVQVQRLTRWHFQRVIVSDFLKAVVGTELVSLGPTGLDAKAKDRLLKPVDADRPMMPVEYAVAAFGSDTAWSVAATRSTPPAAHRCSTRTRQTRAGTARCQQPSRSSGGGSFPCRAPLPAAQPGPANRHEAGHPTVQPALLIRFAGRTSTPWRRRRALDELAGPIFTVSDHESQDLRPTAFVCLTIRLATWF